MLRLSDEQREQVAALMTAVTGPTVLRPFWLDGTKSLSPLKNRIISPDNKYCHSWPMPWPIPCVVRQQPAAQSNAQPTSGKAQDSLRGKQSRDGAWAQHYLHAVGNRGVGTHP